MSGEDTDTQLMHRIGEGDAAAYRLLVGRHLDRLLAFSQRLLSDRAEAEDVAQDCFVRVWRHAATWTPQATVSTWLHRIAYNLCIDRLRARRPSVPVEDIDIEAPGDSAERALSRADDARLVQDALARLPERQRAAILLVHFQELPAAEAAQALGVSIEALESLLSRGRRGLREILTPLRGELTGGRS